MAVMRRKSKESIVHGGEITCHEQHTFVLSADVVWACETITLHRQHTYASQIIIRSFICFSVVQINPSLHLSQNY